MEEPTLQEIYRLTRENNHMLKSMRRRAFWGGLFRLFLYVAALAIPVWLYFTYLSPIVKQMDAVMTKATGKEVQLEGQFGEWAKLLEQFKDKIPNLSAPSSLKQ